MTLLCIGLLTLLCLRLQDLTTVPVHLRACAMIFSLAFPVPLLEKAEAFEDIIP